MAKRNVYIISSSHMMPELIKSCSGYGCGMISGDSLEGKPQWLVDTVTNPKWIFEVVNARLDCIESLANGIGKETIGFFVDSHTKNQAIDSNFDYRRLVDGLCRIEPCLEEREKRLSWFKNMIFSGFGQEGKRLLEKNHNVKNPDLTNMWTRLVLLGLTGYDFEYMPTEADDYLRQPTEKRDLQVYRSICEYGKRNNILFMGIGHELTDLEKTDRLDVYRLYIDYSYPKVSINGNMPQTFRPHFQSMTQKYIPVKIPEVSLQVDIDYQK